MMYYQQVQLSTDPDIDLEYTDGRGHIYGVSVD